MAVIAIREIPEGRSGGFGSDFNGRAARVFRVWTNSAADDQILTVAGAISFGLPNLGDYHPNSPVLRVKSLDPRQQSGTAKIWLITVEYSTVTPDPANQNEDPTLEPVKRSWDTEDVQLPLYRDVDGRPCLNKAGVAFDPPIMLTRRCPRLTFVRNESSFSGAAALQYVDHVNATAFSGAAPGTLICKIRANDEHKKGITYWVVTYEFLYHPLGWQPSVLNQGYEEVVDGKRKRIYENGEPIGAAVPLDEDGQRIPADELPDAAVYLDFDGYFEADFHALGLPA